MNIAEKKSLKDISLPITEEEYRDDGRLHYSTIARFEKTGFNGLDNLYAKLETPSLTFGSMVDELITGSMESFGQKFLVAEFPQVSDTIIQIVKRIFEQTDVDDLYELQNQIIIDIAAEFNYRNNWKPETRAKVIREEGNEYFKLLFLTRNKTLVSTKDYIDAVNAVGALKNSPATRFYFQENSPFEDVERFYQLKFAATFDGIEYSCMADLIVIDHDNQTIIPVDLKTSSKNEWDFFKSFTDWRYDIQARLYWRIIRDNLDRDPYFKDFILQDYRFIVVNRKTLTPLVWEFEDTQKEGTLVYGKNEIHELRHPFDIAKELNHYLEYDCKVPLNINETIPNSITEWLNRI